MLRKLNQSNNNNNNGVKLKHSSFKESLRKVNLCLTQKHTQRNALKMVARESERVRVRVRVRERE